MKTAKRPPTRHNVRINNRMTWCDCEWFYKAPRHLLRPAAEDHAMDNTPSMVSDVS